MVVIITHPDNLAVLMLMLDKCKGQLSNPMQEEIRIKTNKYVPATEFTDTYILPDGSVVKQEDIVVKTTFIEYGPEDLDWLLYAGVIKKHYEPIFFTMRPPKDPFGIVATPQFGRFTNQPDYRGVTYFPTT